MAIWELDGKTIYDFSSQLDYEIKDKEDRLKLVNKILGQRQLLHDGKLLFKDKKDPNRDKRMNAYDDFFATYFSPTIDDNGDSSFPYFSPHIGTANEMNMKQPNSGLKYSSEHDYVCKALQSFGTYLIGRHNNVYPPERELEKTIKVKPRKKSIFKSRKFKVTRKEGIFDSDKKFERSKHESKFPQFISIDRSESREETEHKMAKLIHDMQSLKTELERKKEDGIFTLADSKLYKDVNEIAMEIMHSKHRFIKMRMLLMPSTEINFEEDTGYIDNDDEYKHISYNAITFSDPQHVAGFVTEYPNIKHFSEDREHPLFYHMEIFHNLFNKVVHKLSIEERHILDWYMLDGLQVTSEDRKRNTVQKIYKKTFGETIPKSTVSDLLNKKVPKLISNQYNDEYEEYVYTYKIKGVYHRCSSCGEVKLATGKYFGKDKRNKNGLKSICKVCDRSKK